MTRLTQELIDTKTEEFFKESEKTYLELAKTKDPKTHENWVSKINQDMV